MFRHNKCSYRRALNTSAVKRNVATAGVWDTGGGRRPCLYYGVEMKKQKQGFRKAT